jgi:hypothetical protein
MPISIDGPNKLFVLTIGTTELDVKELYSTWKEWVLLSDNSKYLDAFRSVGGEDIDVVTGTKIPAYIFMLNGWVVRPQEASHTLAVTNGILVVEGGGDPFIDTLGAFAVRINYQQPVQAISYNTGGVLAGLTPTQETMLIELYRLFGLDPTKPLIVTTTTRTAGPTIQQSITDVPGVSTTINRL